MFNRLIRFSSILMLSWIGSCIGSYAQISLPKAPSAPSYNIGPTFYEIGGITVSGNQFLDEDLLLTVAGISVGDKVKIPNDEKIARAIRNLWKQELFSDIQVSITNIMQDKIFLNFHIIERPRLSRYNFRGIRKNEAQELKDKVNLVKARVVTEATQSDAIMRIQKYFIAKGFSNVRIQVKQRPDTTIANSVILTFDINKGLKTKVNQINIAGNSAASDGRLKRTLKGTKEMPRISLYPANKTRVYPEDEVTLNQVNEQWTFLSPTRTLEAMDPYFRVKSILSSSKFNEEKYKDDKQALVGYYNSLGYRDAHIEKDTVYTVDNGHLNIDIKVQEGKQYYFGDIKWKGNTKYTDEQLSRILSIKKGDIYNQELLERRLGLMLGPEGGEDISSLYMDDGYLFFRAEPREISVINDTINYEMVLTEGPQAINRRIIITGNDRTNEHVIRRELRTLPGNKFSRQDLIRSQREISNLGFFDPEKIGINPRPNMDDGTVDIEYSLVEKSSDQLQLSAGFGGGIRFYGNIGIMFNNFSLKNILKPKTWNPLPVGDGQKFSINFQSNGVLYQSLNFSFTEPWLGGKKPNALTTNFIYSRFSGNSADPSSSFLRLLGGGLSLSRRLQWPDDNFILTFGVNYNHYRLRQYTLLENFSNGDANNLFFKLVIARYSINQPLYPTGGSNISMTFQFTPPFSSLSGSDYAGMSEAQKYKWIEYHKYRFNAEWYQRIAGNLVLKLSTKYGFLSYYNKDIGYSPFERFQIGGDGLSGYSFFIGKDIIAHRGYEIYRDNATIFNKYTAEVRYPFSLSPTSTIFGLVFAEAGNAWGNFKEFNPFKLQRAAGVGIRLYLPMFGLLGLDYGIGFDRFDRATGNTGLGNIAKLTFMLGFEPD